MKPLTVKYRPLKFLPFFLSVNRLFPEKWDEVTEKQLKAFELFHAEGMAGNEFIAVMFRLPGFIVRNLAPFEKYTLLDHLDYMRHPVAYLEHVSSRGLQVGIRPDQLSAPLDVFMLQCENQQKNE